jgi:3-hydroxybutyrate dehydrogenase
MPILEETKLQKGNLSGKVAIVTGAAGALGRSIVEALHDQGAKVVGVDIIGEGLTFDVGTRAGCQAMIDKTVELHGTVDILVLNAGFQIVHPIAEFPEADWDRLLDIYLKGPFLAMKAAWPHLISKPGSRILVTASTSSFQAEPFKAPYIAARHGILGLIKVAALEGAPHGLTANCVAPAWMDTPAVAKQLSKQSELRGISEDEVLEGFLSRQPVKRFVKTEEVASVFAFLASPAAAAITGACVPVDLGTLSW